MPNYHFNCEVCGEPKTAWRSKDAAPPRFCSNECRWKGLAGIPLKPTKWIFTPEIHELVKKVYQTSTGNGELKALSKQLKYPRWAISRYALKQGWIAKQRNGLLWSDEEIAILERNAHLSPKRVQMRLKAKGYHRTENAIVIKRKRVGLFIATLDGQSARSLAECLGVESHVITKAIRAGKLKAQKRETERTPQQGGDIYYIKDIAARSYIINNINEIDIRKVDKYWFTDILTGYDLTEQGRRDNEVSSAADWHDQELAGV